MLDEKYGSASACAFMPQEYHEQVVQIIKRDIIKLETQLAKCPYQEFLNAVTRCIDPYQMQILTCLILGRETVGKSIQRERAAGEHGKGTLGAQAPTDMRRGSRQRRDPCRRLRAGGAEFTGFDEC